MKKYIIFAVLLLTLAGAAVLHNIVGASLPYTPEAVEMPYVPVYTEATPDVTPEPATPAPQQLFVTVYPGGHFFLHQARVTLTANHPRATIHYTLDGSVPTSTSAIFTEEIHLPLISDMRVVPLRAIAIYGEFESRPVTHTFFIGAGNRFQGEELLVFSLSAEPYDMFDHYSGILVPGFLRQQFIALNPHRNIIPTDPANFNWRGSEGERPVHVEVFDYTGQRVINQAAGVRVHGAWSRAYDQKSLRLIARREYEPTMAWFTYDLFPDDEFASRYNTLILRNGGNDRNFGMLRNELGSVIARRLGIKAVTPVRPAAVFLNGEYWGFAWLQSRVDAHFFQEMFNTPERTFDIVGNGEHWIDADCADARASLLHKNSFARRDLTDDAIFAELEAILDIDDKLRYYAMQIFMGNGDWPHNNLRRWRYTGEWHEGMAPELDGRWRYLVFDLDWIFGLYGDDYHLDTFQRVLEHNNDAGQLLRAIMRRPEQATRFRFFLEETAEAAGAENVYALITEMFDRIEPEVRHALAAGKYGHGAGLTSVRNNHTNMVNFARGRAGVILGHMDRVFGRGG